MKWKLLFRSMWRSRPAGLQPPIVDRDNINSAFVFLRCTQRSLEKGSLGNGLFCVQKVLKPIPTSR
jgi:hypothetical protein